MPEFEEIDYYRELGVPESATQEQIEAAFLTRVRDYHPDTALEPDPESRKFKMLYEAYRVLSDPAARLAYDRRRATGRRSPLALDSSEGDYTSPGWRHTSTDVRWDIWGHLPTTPEEARWGGQSELRIRRQVDCTACRGSGHRSAGDRCVDCQATGRTWQQVSCSIRLPGGLTPGSVIVVHGYGHQLPRRPEMGKPFSASAFGSKLVTVDCDV